MQIEDIFKQELSISNERWKVNLYYENEFYGNKSIQIINNPIRVNNFEIDTLLKIVCIDLSGNETSYFLTGIDGGLYLGLSDKIGDSHFVKLEGDNLMMSLGFTFVSFNCKTGKIDWKLRPDEIELFEFYEIENDYLVRGEMSIHRITKNGEIKWSYGGRDIWVNVNGKKEVQINSDNIHLLDFEDNEYIIDFNGKTIKDIPKYQPKRILKKWWEFWK